jgi:hypothetical protein
MSSEVDKAPSEPQKEAESTTTTTTTTNATDGEKTNGENGSQKAKKAKPLKPLPPDRLTFLKQIDCLRGYAAKSGPERKAVRLADVAEIVKMHQNTVTLVNPFFSAIGLIQKGESGGYIPAPEVLNYVRALEFNAQTAGQKLAPIISATWFAQELMPKLAFRSMDEQEAMGDLGGIAGVGQEYKSQLKTLLDYLELAGLIQRDGGRITKATSQPASGTQKDQTPPKGTSERGEVGGIKVTQEGDKPGGSIGFHVDIQIEMAEISSWRPDRITAFFAGLAQVLAAKRGVETDGD